MLSRLVKSHEEHLPAVLEEIGTNPEQLKKDVASLREWYSYQTHLPQDTSEYLGAPRGRLDRSRQSVSKVLQTKFPKQKLALLDLLTKLYKYINNLNMDFMILSDFENFQRTVYLLHS